MSNKLEELGVILSTDENGNEQIQRIDCAKEWAEENNISYVKQLDSDEEAVNVVRELVTENYIEKIRQDLFSEDRSLLYALLMGEGLKPISELPEQELIIEAKELGIF